MNNKEIICDPQRRHDFVLLFDVTDGNPNGDPDAGNMPRVDPETMQGIVTDVCLKRKVRNFIKLKHNNEPPYGIYINDEGVPLIVLHEQAYEEAGIKSTGTKQKKEDVDSGKKIMCRKYADIRMFGAVMSVGVNCGQVRGPLQMTFARSIDPVVPSDITITRVAITKKEDAGYAQTESLEEGKEGKNKTTEMGRKALVPYGLYRGHGFFSAPFAGSTGMDGNDLENFWQALMMMWDYDHSASRGMMGCRGLYIFSHTDKMGNASAQSLFDRITITRNADVEAPRKFGDYTVSVNTEGLSDSITLTALVG
ncbi:MAG: type I-C CRISPR-associated protein Cas7/Csd2 [Armatimonadota bacterium]